MNLIQYTINNPVKVLVGVILIVLFGLISLSAIPKQMTPDVERPLITIRTTWEGRSPEEVEKSIVIEQEKKLKSIQGLYQMTSSARLGQAEISLEFNVGYDMGRALQESSNRLNEVKNYPDDVDRPIIRASSAETEQAIGYALIQSENNAVGFDVAEFYDYADRYIKPALERIDGLSQVEIMGGREHEVQVRFNPETLAQAGISVTELRNAISADNVNESAGDLADGRLDVRVRVMGRFSDLEPIRNTIVKFVDGAPIYVKDVAEVYLALKKRTFFDQSRDGSSMTMMFQRESGANVLQVMKDVKKTLKELQNEGGFFRNYKNDMYKVRARMVYDDSQYIEQAIGLVQDNMVVGGLLAVFVLWLFLRSIRPTLVVAIAIPISVIGTFLVMAVTGRTLNVISMAGLSFAIGMVVDNAIVVLENIDRHLQMGKSPVKAAYDATREVWGAIISSTLTTVAVFAPVLTIKEESGQLFYDIALAICAAVLFSLTVSVLVIPVTASRLLKDTSVKRSRFVRILKSLFGLVPLCQWVNECFSSFIYALTKRSFAGIWSRIVIISAISIVAVWLSFRLMPPASYLPTGNKNGVMGMLTLPPGYSLQQNVTIGRRLDETIRPYMLPIIDVELPENPTSEQIERYEKRKAELLAQKQKEIDLLNVKDPLIDMRNNQPVKKIAPIADFFMVISASRTFMMGTSSDNSNVRPMISIINKAIHKLPGATGMGSQQALFGRGTGSNVQVEVIGSDMTRLRTSADYLQKRLETIFSKASVRTNPGSFILSSPEKQIVIDQVRAKELGISVQQIATAVRALIDGVYCGDFDYEGDNIDLIAIRDPAIPMLPDEIPQMPVAVKNDNGEECIMPLSELVRFVPAEASQMIRRLEQERSIQVMVSAPEDQALETVQKKIFQAIDDCRLEGGITPDISIKLVGSADKLAQTQKAMIGEWTGWNWSSLLSIGTGRFFLAMLITYLLMAALFESFLYPFVIMFSVPVAMVGGFLGLAWVHAVDPTQQMDTLTMLGFIILIGVVVNNAILLVHQSLNFMRGVGESEDDKTKPMPPREAIREAIRTRMRPIFMTTATSVLGMLPLVVSPGAGSELYRGLGGVVVGGLTCSSFFTLILVPLLFSLVIDVMGVFGKDPVRRKQL